MTRLQVVVLPGDRFGLVLDEVSAELAQNWVREPGNVNKEYLGAEFVLCFEERCDVVPNNFDKEN